MELWRIGGHAYINYPVDSRGNHTLTAHLNSGGFMADFTSTPGKISGGAYAGAGEGKGEREEVLKVETVISER